MATCLELCLLISISIIVSYFLITMKQKHLDQMCWVVDISVERKTILHQAILNIPRNWQFAIPSSPFSLFEHTLDEPPSHHSTVLTNTFRASQLEGTNRCVKCRPRHPFSFKTLRSNALRWGGHRHYTYPRLL